VAYPRAAAHRSHARARGLGYTLVFRAGLSRVSTCAFVGGVVAAAVFHGASPSTHPSRLPVVLCLAVAAGALATLAAYGLKAASGPATDSPERIPVAVPVACAVLFLVSGVLVGETRLQSLDRSGLKSVTSAVAISRLVEGAGAEGRQPGTRSPGPAGLQVRAVLEEDARIAGGRAVARVRMLEAGPPGADLVPIHGEGALLEIRLPREEDEASRQGATSTLVRGAIVSVQGAVGFLDDPGVVDRLGSSYASYLWREAVHAHIRAESHQVKVEGRRSGPAGVVDRVRASSVRHLGLGLDAHEAGLLGGVVLGDKTGIPQDILVSFRRSGLSHMLATSGLHVAALAGVALGLMLGAGTHRRVALIASLALVAAFAVLVGLGVSIVRASLMAGLAMLGEVVGRGRDKWQGLLIAAAVVLISNPYQVGGAAFQLSFSAVVGLFVLARPLQSWVVRRTRLPAGVAGILAVSAAATAATAPVSFFTFGDASVCGVAANLLVVPLLPGVMALGFGAMAVGMVWGPAAAFLNTLNAVLMGWIVQVASLFARLPTAAEIGALPLIGMILGGLAGLGLRRVPRRGRKVSGMDHHRSRLFVTAVGALAGLVLALGGSYVWSRTVAPLVAEPWPSSPEVRVLDVGQGNATLIRTPGRRAILVDGGPSGCGLAEQLAELGVRRLDLVVVSHPHADHFAGLAECVGVVDVGVLVDGFPLNPASVSTNPQPSERGGDVATYLRMRAEFTAAGASYLPAVEVGTLELGGALFTILNQESSVRVLASYSPAGGTARSLSGEELNGASLVVIVRVGDVAILLPGDAEAPILAGLPLEEVTAVVVPHHGSRGAVDARCLTALSPRLALVSSGSGNSFGHPHDEVLAELAGVGCPVLRTDEVGFVALRAGPDGISVHTGRPPPGAGGHE